MEEGISELKDRNLEIIQEEEDREIRYKNIRKFFERYQLFWER